MAVIERCGSNFEVVVITTGNGVVADVRDSSVETVNAHIHEFQKLALCGGSGHDRQVSTSKVTVVQRKMENYFSNHP